MAFSLATRKASSVACQAKKGTKVRAPSPCDDSPATIVLWALPSAPLLAPAPALILSSAAAVAQTASKPSKAASSGSQWYGPERAKWLGE